MKICAACHEDLPKDKFSKKQWKLEKRRCKICVSDNREVQPLPPSPPTNNDGLANDNASNDGGIDRLLESMSINEIEMISPSDEELFKLPPPKEDCPICYLRMPVSLSGYKYKSCCGKVICSGCIHAVCTRDRGVGLCPFCRTRVHTSNNELIKRLMKRIKVNDAWAMYNLGSCNDNGEVGLPRNHAKALELWHRAGELGNALAYTNIGGVYYDGLLGVGVDEEKARRYLELAAIKGDAVARHNLGVLEKNAGNMERALKHYMISARHGYVNSLEKIKNLFMSGYATKEDYAKALQARQVYLDEIKSDQRDKAAAFDEMYKYY